MKILNLIAAAALLATPAAVPAVAQDTARSAKQPTAKQQTIKPASMRPMHHRASLSPSLRRERAGEAYAQAPADTGGNVPHAVSAYNPWSMSLINPVCQPGGTIVMDDGATHRCQ